MWSEIHVEGNEISVEKSEISVGISKIYVDICEISVDRSEIYVERSAHFDVLTLTPAGNLLEILRNKNLNFKTPFTHVLGRF